jgi:protein NEDD1
LDLLHPSTEPFTPFVQHHALPDMQQVREDRGKAKSKGKVAAKSRENGKGKKKAVEFTEEGGEDDAKEADLSVVVSQRPQQLATSSQAHPWATIISSPLHNGHAQPQDRGCSTIPSNPGGNAPQDLLRSLLSDVLYDFQRTQHEDLVGLHLDLVRMGRGWTRELEGVRQELRELKEENRELREENSRLRRGY